MKKIIIAFTAIITMMLYIASPLFIKPLKAYAANVSYNNINSPAEDICQDYLGTATQPYWHPSTDNSVSLDSDNKVIYLAAKQIRDGSPCDTLGLILYFSNADYSFENGVITLDNVIQTNENCGKYKIVTYYWGSSSIDYWSNNIFKSAVIDLNNKSVILYANTGFTGNHQDEWYIQGNNTVIDEFWDIESNIADLVPDTMNVNVVFTPNLSGHVTRPNITDNGVSRVSEIFTMDITNNSSFGIQYRFDICEYEFTGTDISYFEPNWSTGYSIRGSYGFVYVNDEWIYVQPELTGGIIKTLKSSEWHYIGARDSISQSFSWSQFNLESNKSYIARVVAVPNRCGCATALCSGRGGFGEDYPDYCIDYSEAEYVYNNLFDVVNPASFNPNDTSFGNKIHNSNYSDKYGVSAYENPSNGQLVISNADTSKDFRDILGAPTNGGSHGGGGYYNHNSSSYNNYSSSGNSFSNLNSYFTNFFGFINSALTAFPSIFLTIITLGFTGIVIIGLVKVAFK